VEKLVEEFEAGWKQEIGDYSRKLLEFCCSKALTVECPYIQEKIIDGSFSRLTFDMMLAWEMPTSQDEESHMVQIFALCPNIYCQFQLIRRIRFWFARRLIESICATCFTFPAWLMKSISSVLHIFLCCDFFPTYICFCVIYISVSGKCKLDCWSHECMVSRTVVFL
jgi:hypothetical protein